MEKQELLDNYLNTVINSVTEDITVTGNSVQLNEEFNVVIDSMHLIKGVMSIKGDIVEGFRSVSFFDKEGLELHTIQSVDKGFYLLMKELVRYEESETSLIVCEIKTYDISAIKVESIELYPRVSYEINTVELNDSLVIELSVFLKPDMFNEKITLVKQPFRSMGELYISLQTIINGISSNVPTIMTFLSGVEPYLVLNQNVYKFEGFENNGIRVQLIDLYNTDANGNITFIPYKSLADADYYTLSPDTYHIIDSRIFKGIEDFGNIKALRGIIEEGEGYGDCLLVKLNRMIQQIEHLKTIEMEQEQRDSFLKNVLSIASTVVDEIKDSTVMERIGDSRILWYYKGSMLSLSHVELDLLQSDINTMLSELDTEVIVEE